MSPKSELRLEGGEYAPVAERIARFYERFPDGRITTKLISYHDGRVVVHARVYRSDRTKLPAATGLASELETDGEVNAVACIENTETSAIGRALANLGLTASKNRPSLEEMEKVARVSAQRRTSAAVAASAADAIGMSSNTSAALGVTKSDVRHRPPQRIRTGEDRLLSGVDDGLQARADALAEVLRLLALAQGLGLAPERVTELRASLLGGDASLTALHRSAKRVRRWLEAARKRRMASSKDLSLSSMHGESDQITQPLSPGSDKEG